jgi:putative glutamine amidotransferase
MVGGAIMKKVVIGISGSMIIDEGGVFPGYKRAYVNNDYIRSVIEAGGIPFIIPLNNVKDVMKVQLENVDGLILSGGHDVNPLLYGEEPNQKLGDIYNKRDNFDLELIKLATEMKKPILGICRGHQILNVSGGGTLYQDLSLIHGCYIKHDQRSNPEQPTHTVEVLKESDLHSVLVDEAITNSFQQMSLNKVAEGFKVVARAKDGIIEAIEREEGPFAMGVQWHPEMMSKYNEKMGKIFKLFIEKCSISQKPKKNNNITLKRKD